MQRKFLKELGLEKEVIDKIIDKIMAENGADIENTKKKLEAERDNYITMRGRAMLSLST